jgi:hypothetical protein
MHVNFRALNSDQDDVQQRAKGDHPPKDGRQAKGPLQNAKRVKLIAA